MTALASYSTGTATVSAGGTTVTGTGTIWSGVNVRPGDIFQIGNFQSVIADVVDTGELTIPPWGGGAQTDVAYTIWQVSPQRFAGAQAMADVSTLVAALNADGFFFFVDSAETVPDPSLGNDGQYAYQPSTGAYWLKTGGVWVESGAPAAGYGGTSTTSLAIGAGSKAFTTQTGLAYNGARVRATATSDVTKWLEGPATYTGSTLTIDADNANGSGTVADWTFAIAGEPGDPQAEGRNYLLNPSGEIDQDGVGGGVSRSDGAYDFDQWLTLTQSNPVTVSLVADAENGTPNMMRTLQANASAQRFGRIQWIEAKDCRELRGKAVALSARVRMSAATTLRFAIVEWTGTADTITKDVINDWTNGTFTAGQFFTSTSTTIVAAGSQALSANTLTSISLAGTVSGSMNNLAVLLWTDSTQAQNVTLDVGKVKLEQGSVATSYSAPRIADETVRCKRFFYKGTPPARGLCASTSAISRVGCPHPVPMRTAPSLTVSGNVGVTDGSVAVGINSISTNYSTADTFEIDASVTASTLTANRVAMLYASSGTLSVNARL